MVYYFNRIGNRMMDDITENVMYVNSRNDLQQYFDYYIKDQIVTFEMCEYNSDCKTKSCDTSICKLNNMIHSNGDAYSLKSFNYIAYELFCVSSKYIKFWEDIEELYNNRVNELKQNNGNI